MFRVNLLSIRHEGQRYDTCGDWWFDGEGVLQVRVTKMNDWRHEFLVGVHEVCEAMLCKHLGIKERDVTRFDEEFESRRPDGDTSEPGDDDNAPYRLPHCVATGVERVLAAFMGVSWKEYEAEINSL